MRDIPTEGEILGEPCLRKWQAAHIVLTFMLNREIVEECEKPLELLTLVISTIIMCAADPQAVRRTAKQMLNQPGLVEFNASEICQAVLGVELTVEGLSECIKQDRDKP